MERGEPLTARITSLGHRRIDEEARE